MSEPANPGNPENAAAHSAGRHAARPGENAAAHPGENAAAHPGATTSETLGTNTGENTATTAETTAAASNTPKPRSFTTMLIAYDGSGEARHALEYAAALLQPRHVEILTAWEPLHRQAARAVSMSGLHQADWGTGLEADDPAYEQARTICREGVEIAEGLGLKARAHMVESATSIWSAIVDAAEELRPNVIVTGTRAISGFKSLWQSSTADNIIHNANIPVFVVPPMDSSPEGSTEEASAATTPATTHPNAADSPSTAETRHAADAPEEFPEDPPAGTTPSTAPSTPMNQQREIPQVSGMNRRRTE